MRTKRTSINNFDLQAMKPGEKFSIGGGLRIVRAETGSWLWHQRYMSPRTKKERTGSLGVWNDARSPKNLSIIAAQAASIEWRAKVAKGIDPMDLATSEKEENVAASAATFLVIAKEYLATMTESSHSKHYRSQMKKAVEVDCARFHNRPVRSIETAECYALLHEVGVARWNRLKGKAGAPNWAICVRRALYATFEHAITTRRGGMNLGMNPVSSLMDVIGQKKKIHRPKVQHHKHLALDQIAPFVRAIEAMPDETYRVEKLATKLALITMLRPNEVIEAEWSEIDVARARWDIPETRMKMTDPHIIPLSRQALAILRELHKLTGDTPYLFPERAPRKRVGPCPKDISYLATFVREDMGWIGRVQPHGFRSTAQTILEEVEDEDERAVWDNRWINAQLSHRKRGMDVHYNHAIYLKQRTRMLQAYADMVLPDRAANVVPMKRAA